MKRDSQPSVGAKGLQRPVCMLKTWRSRRKRVPGPGIHDVGGQPVASEGRDRWRWLRHLLLPLILISMIPLLEAGVEENTPTSDEWAHFIRGVSYWTTGDTKLSFAHPPLANAIAGIPFIWEDDVPDLRAFEHWEQGDVVGMYDEYTQPDYTRARAQLVRARRVMWVFPMLLVIYVYWFCLSQFGWNSAAAASLLLAFNPNVLAHGSLVATDLPAAFGYMLAIGEFARYLRGPPSVWRLVTMSVAVGIAILLKHSGILVVPGLALIGLFAAVRGSGLFKNLDRRQRARRYFSNAAVTAVLALFVVNAGFRFNDTGMRVDDLLAKPEPQYWISQPYKQQMLERLTPLKHLPGALRVPLPYTEVFGIACIRGQNKRGWGRSYFWGQKRSHNGHPLYFWVLLFIKTPLPVFILLGAGLFGLYRRDFRASIPTLTIGFMLAYFMLMLTRSNLNMGFRHAMPAVPLLTILAARGFERGWVGLGEYASHTVLRGLLAAALGVMPFTAVAAAPTYLGWFNVVVGRHRGHWISIIGEDWNQDLLRAIRFAGAHQMTPLYVVEHSLVSNLELEWSGVPYEGLACKDAPVPGSFVIVRAAIAKTRRQNCYRWQID